MPVLEDWSVIPKYVPPASEPVTIESPSRHVTVRLDRRSAERVARIARERGVYRQDVLREAVEVYLTSIEGTGRA